MGKTIKIIDLLNKIANGEEVPKKIKYCETIYEKFDYNNKYYDIEIDNKEKDILSEHLASESFYNDEVEIIEEDKKIEKLILNYAPDIEEKIFYDKGDKPNHCIVGDAGTELIIKKINEIIDYLMENKNDKDIK